jgi:septum formation protein
MGNAARSSEGFQTPDILLASRSPRRRELLTQIGISFDLSKVVVPETPRSGEQPADYVERVAMDKAVAGWQLDGRLREIPVLGADTAVIFGDRIMGKPRDREQVLDMLGSLSGQTHQVMSAVAFVYGEQRLSRVVTTDVTFRDISTEEIVNYWNTHEPVDKAGGYAIQGYGAAFVSHLVGSYSNVVGLPLFETSQLLAELNIPVLG